MIDWGKIIIQTLPLIGLLFIAAILSALFSSNKKYKRHKNYKKNNNVEIAKFIILGIILFILTFIFSKTFRTILGIIIIISTILIILGIIIYKIHKNFKVELIDIETNNNPQKNINDDENFEIKFETNITEKEKPEYRTEKIYEKTYIQNRNKTSKKEKGKEYEKFVGKYFENQGYIIKYNGIENEKKDNSIDLIAIKNNEIIFIQCKNWKENNKFKISHKDIKAFIGDTYIFIKENQQYNNYNIKRLFVISNKILDKTAYAYIKEHKNMINYKIIKLDNNKKIN